jgi:mRNA interferase RelE/StbE
MWGGRVLKIAYTKDALKTLTRMPGKVADGIERRLGMLAEDPERTDVDVKPLVGRPGLRLRVGDWRVIFEIDGDSLIVLRIAPRGDVYK